MKYGNFILQFDNLQNNEKQYAYANLGDNFQVLAIDYLYDCIGISKEKRKYINKFKTSTYEGEYVILPAVNTGMLKKNLNSIFPFSEYIIPFFISFTIYNDCFADRPDLVKYMMRYAPIGCRDERTMRVCRKYGIPAYISGCVTMCFPKREKCPRKEKIFIIDVSDELIKHIPDYIVEQAEFVSHAVPYKEFPVTEQENERLNQMASDLLRRYWNEATLVISGRMHGIIPCLAMGIPTICAADNLDFRFAWLDKYVKLYQKDDYSSIDWNPQAQDVEPARSRLIKIFEKSVINLDNIYRDKYELSEIYENRERTQLYQGYYKELIKIKEHKDFKDNFKYLLWGGGQHGYYAYDLIQEIYPNAILVAVVDKFMEGEFINSILFSKPNQVGELEFDYAFITTNPGMSEASNKLYELGRSDDVILMVSQQKC